MTRPQTLQTSKDYPPALLWIMGQLRHAAAKKAVAEFGRAFGDLIPSAHREQNASGGIKWQWYVYWARQALVNAGLMGSAGRGVWTITPAGQQWLAEHPDGGGEALQAHLQLAGKQREPADAAPRPPPRPPARSAAGQDRPVEFTVAGRRFHLSGRQVLERARQALAHGVPPEALQYREWVVDVDGQPVGVKWLFGLATGLSVDQFDSSRARSVFRRLGIEPYRQEQTGPAPSPARSRVRRAREPQGDAQRRYDLLDAEVRAIRDFLDGRSDTRPSDERLCYWVYLCLTLELYAEGWRLFALIDRSQVQKSLYEYTGRFAEVCRMRAT